MPNIISIPADDWAMLQAHLLGSSVEEAAVVFARAVPSSDGVTFFHLRTHCFGPSDFEFQSAYHIELSDEARGWMIKSAWEERAAIIEFHSHVDGKYPAEFSPSDLTGLKEFVPHVWWRLRGQPYAAVVVAPGSFDSLVWSADPNVVTGFAFLQAGSENLEPTGRSMHRRVFDVR